MYEKLEKIAASRGVSVDALIKQWVEEKLAEY
jgi:predicted DNA-binding ribbon-helix-helix protein